MGRRGSLDKDRPTGRYEAMFAGKLGAGTELTEAATMVAEAYLDGKPRSLGKGKPTRAQRDADFWSSQFLSGLPAAAWQREPLVLALARYMGQVRFANLPLIELIAATEPNALRRAIRYSGLVLEHCSPRRREVDHLAVVAPREFGELVRILDALETAYRERLAAVTTLQASLAALTPLELLIYASLYAFEHLVPLYTRADGPPKGSDARVTSAWDAINDLLVWKLGTVDEGGCRLTEKDIAGSVAAHLSPFLFPSQRGLGRREDLYEAFSNLLHAQVELNAFISQSADAFSFDDSIVFEFEGDRLEIVELDPAGRALWVRNGERLARLQVYWHYRALDAFAASDVSRMTIGRPENHELNEIAYVKATRTHLQLTEVYGLSQSVKVDSRRRVDLFQALLSLELVTAFFLNDFVLPYASHLLDLGSSRMALSRLAFEGLAQPGQPANRFPVTWSEREAKAAAIRGWTVREAFPQGNARAAESILDFWTSDLEVAAARLREGWVGLSPTLTERPFLKMGRYLFQLPWVAALQNNTSAAINNLRRLGARRAETGVETRRIEERLARRFEDRGVRVRLNYHPEPSPDDDPGEVDLICVQDGHLLVVEVKSSFLRRSPRDAWLHRAVTLRKASLQLARKVRGVELALTADAALALSLGIELGETPPLVRGWIVDTCIEHDHERFGGFLKVSLEEVLIALRDDSHLLAAAEGLLRGSEPGPRERDVARCVEPPSLYPNGFSMSRFIEVIEGEVVWGDSTSGGVAGDVG